MGLYLFSRAHAHGYFGSIHVDSGDPLGGSEQGYQLGGGHTFIS